MEAVKQGSATVGLKSKSHAILVALKVRHLVHLIASRNEKISENFREFCKVLIIMNISLES